MQFEFGKNKDGEPVLLLIFDSVEDERNWYHVFGNYAQCVADDELKRLLADSWGRMEYDLDMITGTRIPSTHLDGDEVSLFVTCLACAMLNFMRNDAMLMDAAKAVNQAKRVFEEANSFIVADFGNKSEDKKEEEE